MKNDEMLCPVCKNKMNYQGQSGDITVYCATPHGDEPGQCRAQEVSGHGKTIKDAYEIVKEKFRHG